LQRKRSHGRFIVKEEILSVKLYNSVIRRRNQDSGKPTKKITERAAAATGKSIATIFRIRSEARNAERGELYTPRKEREEGDRKYLDDMGKCIVRTKVHSSFTL